MKRIVVVQSRTNEGDITRERANFERSVGTLAEIDFLSALDERLAWSSSDEFLANHAGVIFGGSADFDFDGGRPQKDPMRIMSIMLLTRTRNLVAYALQQKIPLLGICYGHQLIANMFGGDVRHDKEQMKFGSYDVKLTEEGKRDALFKDLPELFTAQYAHKDAVTELPEGATLLASTDGCRFSILKYNERAYTTQFHPEVEKFTQPVTNYKPSPEASKIVSLWLERVVA